MAAQDKLVLFGARYDSAEAAERDYDAVKSLYYDLKIIDTFDAAILNKDEKGKVTIVKKHEQPTRSGGWRGAGIGLATGAVIALFPAAAIGTGLLAATTGGGAILGAVAGHVTAGMSRSDLMDLGEHLDAGQSGIIVVAVTDLGVQIENVLANAAEVKRKDLEADEKAMDEDVAAAGEE